MVRLVEPQKRGISKGELKDKLMDLCNLEKEKRLEDALDHIPEDEEVAHDVPAPSEDEVKKPSIP